MASPQQESLAHMTLLAQEAGLLPRRYRQYHLTPEVGGILLKEEATTSGPIFFKGLLRSHPVGLPSRAVAVFAESAEEGEQLPSHEVSFDVAVLVKRPTDEEERQAAASLAELRDFPAERAVALELIAPVIDPQDPEMPPSGFTPTGRFDVYLPIDA